MEVQDFLYNCSHPIFGKYLGYVRSGNISHGDVLILVYYNCTTYWAQTEEEKDFQNSFTKEDLEMAKRRWVAEELGITLRKLNSVINKWEGTNGRN